MCNVEFLGKDDVDAKYLYGLKGRPENYVEKKSVEDYFIDKRSGNPLLDLKAGVDWERIWVKYHIGHPILILP